MPIQGDSWLSCISQISDLFDYLNMMSLVNGKKGMVYISYIREEVVCCPILFICVEGKE